MVRSKNRAASSIRGPVRFSVRARGASGRSVFERIGTFDEQFFLYHEEVDFAKRAAGAGFETWYVPASEAVHEGMGSARGQYNVEKRKQTSRRKYWIKHHGAFWYATLVAALVGRYAVYLGLAIFGFVMFREALRPQ